MKLSYLWNVKNAKNVFATVYDERRKSRRAYLTVVQCDLMVILFFKIRPFATMKISPIMSQICQSRLSILPNKKWPIKTCPRPCKLLPKWRNFAKSGHIAVIAFLLLPSPPSYERFNNWSKMSFFFSIAPILVSFLRVYFKALQAFQFQRQNAKKIV